MNVKEYVEKYGHLTIKEEPFNYVDSAILSKLTYCKFDGLFKKRKETIKTLADRYLNIQTADDRFRSFNASNDEILYLAANADRYKDLKAYNYESKIDRKQSLQFAAMMIDLPDKTSLVIYRGTDGSMIGWHEDFMLAYTKIKAQEEAINYFNKHCKIFHKYRVVGHSKGGNLALNTCVNVNKFKRNRIKQIINLDGPSLRIGSYNQIIFNELKDRYVKIVPDFDIIGTIYDNSDNKIIVKSFAKGMEAHDIIAWQIDDKNYKDIGKLAKESKMIGDAILTFYEETTEKQREELNDRLFKCINEENIYTVKEFYACSKNTLLKILHKTVSYDESTKQAASKLFKILLKVLGQYSFNKVQTAKEKVKTRVKKQK